MTVGLFPVGTRITVYGKWAGVVSRIDESDDTLPYLVKYESKQSGEVGTYYETWVNARDVELAAGEGLEKAIIAASDLLLSLKVMRVTTAGTADLSLGSCSTCGGEVTWSPETGWAHREPPDDPHPITAVLTT